MHHEREIGRLPEKPQRLRTLDFSEIEATGESILYDSREDKATVLSPLGAVVWLLCDGERTVDAICREIMQQFNDIDEDALRSDIEALLGDFLSEGLLDT